MSSSFTPPLSSPFAQPLSSSLTQPSSSTGTNLNGPNKLPSAADDDMDADTAALIAQLYLEDLEDLYRSRKGKARADAPLSSEESALEAQKRYFEQLMTVAEDEKLARSIGTAIEMDQDYLNAFLVAEAAAVADRRAAELLSRGESLPEPNAVQARLESRDFVMHPEPPKTTPSSLGKQKAENLDPDSDSDEDSPKSPIGIPVKNVSSFDHHNHAPSNAYSDSDSSSDDDEHRYRAQQWFGGGQVSRFSQPTSVVKPTVVRSKLVECIICNDQFRSVNTLQAPCEHYYCQSCVGELIQTFIRDESLFPLRCCQKAIPITSINPFVTDRLRAEFLEKNAEFSVLSKDRVYCITPTCSRFLGSGVGVTTNGLLCTACGGSTCARCKEAAHGDEDCTVHASTLEVKALAKREGWQTCPGCETVVELDLGCYHMTCRCRTQFCYLCAVEWKNCECPQWEEARLLATAQQRVENELGARAVRNILPEAFQQRVQERAQTLRVNHNCERHNWRYRPGGGRCEECHFNLPQYLLVCRGCSLLACVRCSRNRL